MYKNDDLKVNTDFLFQNVHPIAHYAIMEQNAMSAHRDIF